MSYNLFLDDLRELNWVYPDADPKGWIVCRTYDDAVSIVYQHGWPSFISFDHDLGEDSTESGFSFAKKLVEFDLDFKNMPADFSYAVHSANPLGAANIRGLLENYLNSKKE